MSTETCPYWRGFDAPKQCTRACRGFECRWRAQQMEALQLIGYGNNLRTIETDYMTVKTFKNWNVQAPGPRRQDEQDHRQALPRRAAGSEMMAAPWEIVKRSRVASFFVCREIGPSQYEQLRDAKGQTAYFTSWAEANDAIERATLADRANKAAPRRFTGEPPTGFGSFDAPPHGRTDMPTFYRRGRMRKPSPLPSVIWLGWPLWLRVLRAIVRPLVLAHLHAQLGHLDEEEAHYTRDSNARGYLLGKDYVHNCAVQRKALRESIANWNR